ncbi:MAG: hypothetical protein O2820_06565 [Planctomycetota bacterium]|nr:hypothetical protein [Planctomycetota bacterium]MDA1248871.1 hypothetical protein [Planctomycetota bacterium]
MRTPITTTLAGLLATLCFANTSSGQTIQQPIFEQIGVQTSVMVPDRGGVYLGGVKRARESSRSTPFGLGSSIGREVSNTGISAHVYISDLHEMDHLILNSPDHGFGFGVRFVDPGPHYSRFSEFSSPAMRAPCFVQSIGRVSPVPFLNAYPPAVLSSRGLSSSRVSSSPVAPPPPKKPEKPSLDASRSLRLGQEAEADGKDGLAVLHYRTAAQFGSMIARERLTALGDTAKIKTLASK